MKKHLFLKMMPFIIGALLLAGCGAENDYSESAYSETGAETAKEAQKKSENSVISGMYDVEKNEKTINLESDDLQKVLGLTDAEVKKAKKSEKYAKKLLKMYGYSETEEGVYETDYPYSRIIINAEIDDKDAVLSETSNGITVLQYSTPEEAALAANSFNDEGYYAIPDDSAEASVEGDDSAEAETAVSSGYESTTMQLACNEEKGDGEVVVAVIDTGCNTNVFGDDGDRFLTGYNAIDDNEDVTDNAGHGTMTASCVTQNTNDKISILPIKMMDANSETVYYSTVVKAFAYAKKEDVDIVNISLYINDSDGSTSSYLGEYLEELINADITVCVAAGNDSTEVNDYFPANQEGVWTITATNKKNEFTDFTNFGSGECEVDFCAPGKNITVINSSGNTTTNSGTSFSSPLVAACAAQLASMGYDTNEERYAYIKENATDLGEVGYDDYYGNGLVVMTHNYTEETKDATCTTAGTVTYTCDCGEEYDEYTTLDHSYETTVTEPTCTEQGYTTYTCSACKDSYVDDYTDAKGHSYESEVTTEATCTEDGEKTYTCSVCGDTYTETVEATGHTYEAAVTEPTCTEQGYTTYTCSVCGYRYVDDYTDATGHTWDDGTVTTEATCTEDGEKTYTCSVCGDTYTETIAATGHSYDDGVVTNPTCTEGGYTTYTCSVCSDSYMDDYTDALDHDYDTGNPEWTWSSDYSTATVTFTCKNDASHTETVDATVTSETNSGKIIYTATAAYNGTVYTDTKETETDADGDTAAVSISEATVTLAKTSYTYNGTARKPGVTVALNGTTLTKGTDYTVSYSNNTNAGTATVTVTGKGDYSGTVTKTFTIKKKPITSATVTLSKTAYEYDGTAKKPTVTVKITLNGTTQKLTRGTDYTVTYSNNVKAGTATVTIKGKGNFDGSILKSFTITEASEESSYTVPTSSSSPSSVDLTGATESQVSSALSKLTSDDDLKGSSYSGLQAQAKKVNKKSITVKWKKVSGAKKYVVYANACGKGKKLKALKTTASTKLKVTKVAGKKLKSGKYYKFLVVAYDSSGKVISTSKIVHAATKGSKKTNAKKITITKSGKKASSLSLKAKGSAKIKAKVTKTQWKGRIKNHRKTKYESSDATIATVSSSGKITAKKKGTCYIYAYAQNGASKKIKVTVK